MAQYSTLCWHTASNATIYSKATRNTIMVPHSTA